MPAKKQPTTPPLKSVAECHARLMDIMSEQNRLAEQATALRREENLLIAQLSAWECIRESMKQ